MVCINCGRQINNEEANFCEYCGYSFREHKHAITQEHTHTSGSNTQSFGTEQVREANSQERMTSFFPKQATTVQRDGEQKEFSFWSWLSNYGLFFIPVIGTILFPIALLVWSFSSTISPTKRNWARATLIFFLLFMFYMSYILSVMLMNPATMEFLQGNIDVGEYLRQISGN